MASDPLDKFRRQQEMLAKLSMPPAVEAIRKQQGFLDAIRKQAEMFVKPTTPSVVGVDVLRSQQEMLAKLSMPPAVEAIRKQQGFFDAIRKQQDLMANFAISPAFEAIRKQQEQVERLLSSSVLAQIEKSQKQFAWTLSESTLEQIRDYQDALVEKIVDYANETPVGEANVENDRALIEQAGSRSWRFLLWEMEGLLKILEIMTSAMGTVDLVTGTTTFPEPVLAVAVTLIMIGEFALWLANGSPNED
jgi:hypothetical protein